MRVFLKKERMKVQGPQNSNRNASQRKESGRGQSVSCPKNAPLNFGWRVIAGTAAEAWPSSPDDADTDSYRPSVFYYRRALRATNCPIALHAIALALHAEIKQVRSFAADHLAAIESTRSQPDQSRSLSGETEIHAQGLSLCRILESAKHALAERGLIPPKRHIMRSEAEEKGWDIENAG